MSEPFVGEIILVGFNFAPAGWALCDGHLMAITGNETLFNLIGTTYGGDGQTTFGLPDLRGRVPLGTGQGPGLTPYTLGEQGGSETVTLSTAQLPSHNHAIDASALTATARCKNGPGNQQTPVGNVPAIEAVGVTATYSNAVPDANMNSAAIALGGTIKAAPSGGSLPHDNTQPSLVMNYCISLFGIFPSQT
jgi:microcystin-dependent protein